LADAYLNIAERVLSAQRTPMRPASILRAAQQAGLLADHLFGRTQDKTLHARLSEDIASFRDQSRFFRTSPGTFFLRALQIDPDISEQHKAEFFAPPRRKELRRDWVLTISAASIPNEEQCFAIQPEVLRALFRAGEYRFRPYSNAREDATTALIHSFVIVHRGHLILSYRTGRFHSSTDLLYGKRSIGVGGIVLMDDADLLYDSMYGVVENGIDELVYAVGLPLRLAERARYENELHAKTAVATLRTESQPAIVRVVLSYECPDDFSPSKAALSVNDLRWIDPQRPGNTIEDYDLASRWLLENWRSRSIGMVSSV
jgi:hypothetical protein